MAINQVVGAMGNPIGCLAFPSSLTNLLVFDKRKSFLASGLMSHSRFFKNGKNVFSTISSYWSMHFAGQVVQTTCWQVVGNKSS